MTTLSQETIPAANKNMTSPQISARAKSTQDSPIRKLSATAEARKQKGIKVYHLNIGQPDLPTPQIVFDTIRDLKMSTLAYAPSNGLPQALQAWKTYFEGFALSLDEKEIIVTAGGSEAIVFAMCAKVKRGDRLAGQAGPGIGQGALVGQVGDGHDCPLPGEPPRDRGPAAEMAQSHHRHSPSAPVHGVK